MTCYFLPGQMDGKPIQFLIDTGCTNNLLSKSPFGLLPNLVKKSLEETQSHALLEDGILLSFYVLIWLTIWVRDTQAEEVFVISCISEGAILGVHFLIGHSCPTDFVRPAL